MNKTKCRRKYIHDDAEMFFPEGFYIKFKKVSDEPQKVIAFVFQWKSKYELFKNRRNNGDQQDRHPKAVQFLIEHVFITLGQGFNKTHKNQKQKGKTKVVDDTGN